MLNIENIVGIKAQWDDKFAKSIRGSVQWIFNIFSELKGITAYDVFFYLYNLSFIFNLSAVILRITYWKWNGPFMQSCSFISQNQV